LQDSKIILFQIVFSAEMHQNSIRNFKTAIDGAWEMKETAVVALDAIDRQIIDLLAANARITNAELAEKTGIAQSTCILRVRALVSKGVITGFHASVNAAAVGLGLQVLISVTLRATARQQLSQFMADMRQLPEVVQVFFLGGSEDFIVHLAVKDSEQVREFVLEHLSANAAVANTRTNMVFEHFLKSSVA
jgi:DNA-binding Lrp family transcriptional regulator